jgi:hypothetical protein
MGAIGNLEVERKAVVHGLDSVVIRNYVAGIIGGKTLDMTGFEGSVIKAGHVVIVETATDTYKPMPVKGEAYDALPSGHAYAGVVVCSQPADKPFVGIMYDGEVNDVACPYPVEGIKAAMKTALPKLTFMHD